MYNDHRRMNMQGAVSVDKGRKESLDQHSLLL